MNYKRYAESLSRTPEPILLKDIPGIKCNVREMIAYAKKKGVSTMELTEEERLSFCEPVK